VFPNEYRRALKEMAGGATEGGSVMGKPTGFLEFQRISESYEKAETRVKHYREFVRT
jgi:hypothetical protein